jgi:hypothetical protein
LFQPNIVHAQFSLPQSNQISSNVPKEVIRYGSIEVTYVKSPLDGKQLFQIASPTIFNRSNINEVIEAKLPVEIRSEEVRFIESGAIGWIRSDFIIFPSDG